MVAIISACTRLVLATDECRSSWNVLTIFYYSINKQMTQCWNRSFDGRQSIKWERRESQKQIVRWRRISRIMRGVLLENNFPKRKMLTAKRIVCDGNLNHFLDWETRIKFGKRIDFYEICDYGNYAKCFVLFEKGI